MLRKEEKLCLRRRTVFNEELCLRKAQFLFLFFEVVGMWVSILIFWIVGLLR
jgi:hypothetical protein